ncbi:hypothetical protein BGX27_010761, partial [Mortierella sp. AM989]
MTIQAAVGPPQGVSTIFTDIGDSGCDRFVDFEVIEIKEIHSGHQSAHLKGLGVTNGNSVTNKPLLISSNITGRLFSDDNVVVADGPTALSDQVQNSDGWSSQSSQEMADSMKDERRSENSLEHHELYFTKMFSEIDVPTLPYGLSSAHCDGIDFNVSQLVLPQGLHYKLHDHAKQMGVSFVGMFHLAWAQVVARISGQERVVFGTVISGCMRSGSANGVREPSASTLPLRVDIDSNSAHDSVRYIQVALAALVEHEHAPLALVHRCSGISPGSPLFASLLNCQMRTTKSVADDSTTRLRDRQENISYPFTMNVEEGDNSIILTAQVVNQFDSSRICGYMQQTLQSLVDALDNTPNIPIRELEVLPVEEREMLIQSWNASDKRFSDHQCIHQLFEAQVEQSPDAIAIVYEDQAMSYRELNERSNKLAYHLVSLGVQPESLVAICVGRSPTMLIALLAVLKAGGAYVPLDPSFASERLHNIFEDASPSILLADNSGVAVLSPSLLHTVKVIDPNKSFEGPTSNPQVLGLTSDHLAYVIYTSGSTGKPKGVMIEHRGVTNLAMSRPSVFRVDSDSKVLQFFSFSFDGSVHEIVSALCFGGSLHILSDSVRLDRVRLWTYLEENSITHVTLTPAVLQDCENLMPLNTSTNFLLAGEALPLALLRSLKNLVPNGSIVNDYGPTETTVDAVAWRCPEDFDGDVAPIGRPNANKKVYVLDNYRKPVPVGAIGELYIAGTGVARGYLKRPDLTDKAFLQDPFTIGRMSRMYKTGDLVRYLPDGNLMFMGRNDHQVKIRGFRVELGEIETRLSEHPMVREAVVLGFGEGSSKRLVAYIVAGDSEGLAYTLREHLAAKLPEYMIPAAFVRMDSFPLTSTGKLDRQSLPEPNSNAFASQGYEAPEGEFESILASIWSELLKIDRVGRNDNFFMLGGHSLLGVQMIERLRHIGLELSARVLFETPTLSALSQSLNRSRILAAVPINRITTETTKIIPEMLPLIDLTQDDIDIIVNQVDGGVGNIQDIYALSPLQDGILFHHIMATKGDPYLLLTKRSFENRGILDRYLEAVQKVADRHDALRTAIMWENLSVPAQVVLRHAPISITELLLNPSDGPILEQLTKLFDPRSHRIDLTQAPLIRFAIAQDIDGHWIAVSLLHHLIGDHSTLEVMTDEIREFLESRGESLSQPQSFRNLVAQTRSMPNSKVHEKFFTKMLADIDTPSLQYGISDVLGDGLDIIESHLMLPKGLNDSLRNHARRMGVSLASLCHLAWAQVMSRTSGQERVVFGTVLFGRMQGGSGADRAMGLFINTLPIRVDVGGATVEDSVRQTQRDLAALLEHEHAPLALAQRCSSIPTGTPLFGSLLNYRHDSNTVNENSAIPGVKFLGEDERTSYPFVMSIEDGGTTLGLTAQVIESFDASRICGYMHRALESLVDALEHTSDMPVRCLEILPVREYEMLVQSWNATDTMFPGHLCVDQLFENQVAQTPDSTAISYGDQVMSYCALNAHANRRAVQLKELGCQPGDYIATTLERSFELIITQLAILKIGASYVPIDPKTPTDRQSFIINDCAARLLVVDVDTKTPELLDTMLLRLSNNHQEEVDLPKVDFNLHRTRSSADTAYAMYTSGSTGIPKGVLVSHRSIAHLTINNRYANIGADDRVAFAANPAFDASTFE